MPRSRVHIPSVRRMITLLGTGADLVIYVLLEQRSLSCGCRRFNLVLELSSGSMPSFRAQTRRTRKDFQIMDMPEEVTSATDTAYRQWASQM